MSAIGFGKPRAHEGEGSAVPEKSCVGRAFEHRRGLFRSVRSDDGEQHAVRPASQQTECRAVFAGDGNNLLKRGLRIRFRIDKTAFMRICEDHEILTALCGEHERSACGEAIAHRARAAQAEWRYVYRQSFADGAHAEAHSVRVKDGEVPVGEEKESGLEKGNGRFAFQNPEDRPAYEAARNKLGETVTDISLPRLTATPPDNITPEALEALSVFIKFREGGKRE